MQLTAMCCDSLPVMVKKSLEKRRKKYKAQFQFLASSLIAGKVICNAVKFAYDFIAVVLNLFYLMYPLNRYSHIKSPLRNIVCKEHFYIGILRI